MPEEISNEKFKTEIMRFVEVANQKFDGLISDVRTNSFKLDKMEAEIGIISRKSTEHDKRFDMVDTSLEILREQTRMVGVKIDDVAAKVMEIDKRLKVVEAQLSLMDTKLTTLEDETRQIRFELNDLNETNDIGAKTKEQLTQLEFRVFHLEEKILV